jgi:uncharacterized protein YkwD
MRRCYRRTLAICATIACAAPGASRSHAASPTAYHQLQRHPHRSARHRIQVDGHAASAVDQLAGQMLQLLNTDRADAGLAPLTLDRQLTDVATSHSHDMAARHYFAHTAPGDDNPFERFARKGIRYNDAGENIGQAGGRPLSQEVSTINATMMAEPLDGASHHDVIVDPGLHRVGVGICVEPGNTIYLTEDFTG